MTSKLAQMASHVVGVATNIRHDQGAKPLQLIFTVPQAVGVLPTLDMTVNIPRWYHMSLGWLPTFKMTKRICDTILISHVVGVSPTFDMHVVGVSPTFDMCDLPIYIRWYLMSQEFHLDST